MGNCYSSFFNSDPDHLQQVKASKIIDKTLKEDEKQMTKEVKILLLGAGESVDTSPIYLDNPCAFITLTDTHPSVIPCSYTNRRSGKTTVLKQMQIVHNRGGFTSSQKEHYRQQVRRPPPGLQLIDSLSTHTDLALLQPRPPTIP
jgi:hypothetical protein